MTRPTDDPVHWLDDHEQRAWMAMLEVGSGLFGALSVHLKRNADITLEDYEVLHWLSQEPDQTLRIGWLSGKMLASRTRLSQRIDRLEARRLVERSPCKEDGRAINVSLTPTGGALLEQTAPTHLDEVRRLVFDHLDDADVRSLARSLGKVAQVLHDERAATHSVAR